MVTDSYLPRTGGIELHMRDLSLQLAQAGHQVHIVSPFGGDVSAAGVHIDQVTTALWPRFQFAWTPAAVYRLEAILRAGSFDVVHHHVSIFSPFTVASIGLCLQLGIPVVVTGHSLWRGYARALLWMDRIFSWSEKPLVVSGVSAAVARDLAPLCSTHGVELLPNGIDVAFWKGAMPETASHCPKTVRIVSVLRLARRKRPRVLVDIAARLRAELPPEIDFHWDIVGEGTERPYLEQLIATHALSSRVTLRGHRTRDEIRDIFRQSDVFLLPTAEEAFGIAALEARTAGLPVVALDNGGVGEIIRDGTEGLLARSDEELVSHLITLMTNVELRQRIATHNACTAPAESWPDVIGQHERVYALAAERMQAAHA